MPFEILELSAVALGVLALIAVIGLLARIRSRRISRWTLILDEPASSVLLLSSRAKRTPKWIQQLPKGLSLNSEAEIVEILYRHFRTHPSLFGSTVLSLALTHVDAPGSSSRVDTKRIGQESFTDEEKIKTLMGAKPDSPDLVPTEALAENVVLNLVNVLKGKKKLTVGLEHALLDSLGAAGGLAGSKVGGVVGIASASLLTGLSLPLVPVLVLLGALLGSFAGKRAGGWLKGWRHFAALRKMHRASRGFKKWFLAQFPEFLVAREQDFRDAIAQSRELYRVHQNRFSRFWFPDLMAVFLKKSLGRLEHDRRAEKKRLERLRASIRSMDPLEFAAVLVHLDPASAQSNPELLVHFEAYQAALAALRASHGAAPASVTQKSA